HNVANLGAATEGRPYSCYFMCLSHQSHDKSDPHLLALRVFFFEQNSDVDLIAHRGGDGQWPGSSTIAAARHSSTDYTDFINNLRNRHPAL
ncbi:MAG TPA: hypothetical protein VK868_01350, partial [Pyrinomonadaceae bacterium]|nr:hypothetical protein [Pyrinomonadaceae bacterium]